ncbi:hypothetical protein Tco_0518234 [Tanacetum coccineum]
MVEDLDNYHLKELRCSTQCHTQKTLWIIARGDESLVLWWGIEYLEICLEHKFSTPKTKVITVEKISVATRGFWCIIPTTWGRDVRNSFSDDKRASSGKKCEKNYSSVRRYVADPVNVSPNGQPLSLLSKEKDLKWFATNTAGEANSGASPSPEVYGLLSSCLGQYFSYKKCMKKVVPSSRSKATEDIISIGSFVEVLVLNYYVLVRKILGSYQSFKMRMLKIRRILRSLESFGGGSLRDVDYRLLQRAE